jgi:hypothetical protein
VEARGEHVPEKTAHEFQGELTLFPLAILAALARNFLTQRRKGRQEGDQDTGSAPRNTEMRRISCCPEVGRAKSKEGAGIAGAAPI